MTENSMKVVAISARRGISEQQLIEAHYKLRAQVFLDQPGWEVDVQDGMERDCFDALHPTYIIAISESGRMAGCARLLPTVGPKMVVEVFALLLPDGRLNSHPSMNRELPL
jgi:acyl homoserine lactone synthase